MRSGVKENQEANYGLLFRITFLDISFNYEPHLCSYTIRPKDVS